MNYSVADAIVSLGEDAISGQTGDISAILAYGIAPGAKAVMRKEKLAAEEAISTGVYVTWRSNKTKQDCARVGSMSRCFCGCSYEMHAFRNGRSLPVCTKCECQGFDFVPSRPEEIGEWWLPRRPGFDVSSWRAKCRCGHSHEAHHPSRRTCGSCKCSEFYSAYGCVVCDSHQEDHQTQAETARERINAGRAVGKDFIPLSQSPQLSQLTFGRDKNKKVSAGASSSKPAASSATTSSGGGGGGGGGAGASVQTNTGNQAASGSGRSRPSSGFANLAVVARNMHARGFPSRRSSVSPSSSRNATTAPLISTKIRHRRLMGPPKLTTALRLNCDEGSVGPGGVVSSASPELLYASGRITAARYHEVLAERDGRTGLHRAMGGSGVGRHASFEKGNTSISRNKESAIPAIVASGRT